MRFKAADCSLHAFQAFAPCVPSSLFISSPSFRLRNLEMDKPVSSLLLSSKTLLKSRSFNNCSLNLDEKPSFYVEGSVNLGEEEEGRHRHCSASKNSSASFLGGHSRFDFLEPMMLGIQPEYPDWDWDWDWPHEELATVATIERRAKSLDIPLSLRIIKKKLQLEEGFYKGGSDSDTDMGFCFASMVSIIAELQTCALRMREALYDENLEIITSKVQKEMHMSLVWLFHKVFSRTPVLMLHVMMLFADFGVREVSLFVESMNADSYQDLLRTDLSYRMNITQEPDNALWICNYAQFLHLVAHDYLRSEKYFKRAVQLTPPDAECLTQYAHFLWTVRKDYWAAEESFLQAIALEPHNNYYASRYANFLWSTGGEETCYPLNNV